MKGRRPRLVQFTPEQPTALFTFCDTNPDVVPHCWHLKIRDAIVGDEPEWTYTPPGKSKYPPFTPQQIANAGAGELNEGSGLVTMTEYRKGVPTFVARYAANGRQVFCIWSTDEDREPWRETMDRIKQWSAKSSTGSMVSKV